MRLQLRLLLAISFCVLVSASSVSADTVVANSIADLQIFPTNGQDRNEMILGNANGDRTYVTRFDTTVIEPFLNSDYNLVSASVRLVEQFGRDGSNGNQARNVSSYFLATGGNSLWNYNDVANLNSTQDGTTPWLGNTQARPGRFGGQGSGGPSNVDLRADIDNPQLGTAFGAIQFVTGQQDSMMIDLTAGSGITLADIETILADWVAGDNAGLGFMDADSVLFGGTAPGQIFFQSGNVAGGNPVNSTINGMVAGSGVAQSGELGQGLGGPQLVLEFEFKGVPEPGTASILSCLALLAINRRKR